MAEETVPAMFEIVLILIAVPLSVLFHISQMTEVTVTSLQTSYHKLSILDATHSIENCIAKNRQTEGIQKTIDDCRKEGAADYIQLFDIQAGKQYESGNKKTASPEYAIHTNIADADSIHQARLYVRKDWKAA